jgi:murein DD-endopeptidase MepM/ murein hydrolase activator NlpD
MVGVHRIMTTRIIVCALISIAGLRSPAAADPKVVVTPSVVRPGDPVLVTVTGTRELPHGAVNGKRLQFFASRTGYQAVFATALDATTDAIAAEDAVTVDIDGAPPQTVRLRSGTFAETSVIVEDELANPSKADRARIDADNAAIIHAAARASGEPQFARPFRRPPGEVMSAFGTWRTFNDGHRSQHLGLDLFAREGSRVNAINAGTVVLVRDCFLAGNVVVIAHGGGIASAYYHLSQISVAEGDTVAPGDEIGRAGHTGRATGPHLHLSIHVPGGMVNPAAFFPLQLAPAGSAVTQR